MSVGRNCMLRFFIRVTCPLLLLSVAIPDIPACSWDFPIWMIRSRTADPLYRFVVDGKAGYIDRNGKVVIEPNFKAFGNHGDEFHDGLMPTGFFGGNYLDTSGKLAFDKWYYQGFEFSEGLAAAGDKYGEKWGYIDTRGEFVISPRFDSVPSSFSEGLAKVHINHSFGYIDRTGKIVIPPKFVYCGDFHDGLARVVTEGPCAHTSPGPCADTEILPEKSPQPEQAPPCKYGFIDRSGNLISEKRYDSVTHFSEGVAAVQLGTKWGYIDKKGEIVVEPRFDYAGPFAQGLARVQRGRVFGYIDQAGVFAIPPEFGYAEDFSEGLAVVAEISDKGYREFCYINKQGKLAIPEKFDLASHFFKGLAHVKLKSNEKEERGRMKGEFAYIEVTGKRVFTYTSK
jgi:hypothetical protein